MFDKRQYHILSERYFECMLGDFSSLIWMIGQAPLIAGLIILRWKSWQATDTLYFILALSSVWFGCINACREIAKELPIFQRESLFGLNRLAYLISKVKILVLIGLLEIGIFVILLHQYIDLDLQIVLAFCVCMLLYCSGAALGLLLSRWLGSVAKAVVAVPIAILPQIIFSKFVLPENSLHGASEKISKLMIAKWGYEALTYCRSGDIEWKNYLLSILSLSSLGLLFLLLTYLHLQWINTEARGD